MMVFKWLAFTCLAFTLSVIAEDIEVFIDKQVVSEKTGIVFGPFYIRKESPDMTVPETGPKQEFKNCGGKAEEFKYGWTPKGPLKIGQTYNFTFDATAAHDMRTGTAEPIIYFNEYLILDTTIFFCKLIPKEYKICPIKKGEKIHVSTSAQVRGKYVQKGRYHGNTTVTNEKGEQMLCILGDVQLD
ncbi:uncharacterized protein [Ptychodera flava]|uniref:uncharacterized protein isoform X1 n=1 Tax=Ptychodera flava TaxID=63121 RepID=UPI003969E3C7